MKRTAGLTLDISSGKTSSLKFQSHLNKSLFRRITWKKAGSPPASHLAAAPEQQLTCHSGDLLNHPASSSCTGPSLRSDSQIALCWSLYYMPQNVISHNELTIYFDITSQQVCDYVPTDTGSPSMYSQSAMDRQQHMSSTTFLVAHTAVSPGVSGSGHSCCIKTWMCTFWDGFASLPASLWNRDIPFVSSQCNHFNSDTLRLQNYDEKKVDLTLEL